MMQPRAKASETFKGECIYVMKRDQNQDDPENQMPKLVSDFPIAVMVTDEGGNVIASNERAVEIIGFDLKELIGTPIEGIFNNGTDAATIGAQLATAERRKPFKVEIALKGKEGMEQLVSLSVSLFYNSEGVRTGCIYCFERIERFERDPALLRKVSDIINETESLQQGMQKLAEMITNLLSSSFCRILLLDETGRLLVPKAAYHTHRDGSFQWNDCLGEGTPLDKWPRLESRLNEGKTTVLSINNNEDASNLRMLTERLHLDKPIQCVLSVPLKAVNGKVVGLLHVGEIRNEARQMFNDEKIALAQAIAAMVLTLIDNLRLKETSKLGKVVQALVSSPDTNDLYKQIIEGAKTVLNADSAVLWSYDESQDKLTLESQHDSGIPDDIVGEIARITPGKHGTAAAVMQHGLVAVSDVHDTGQFDFIGPRTNKVLTALRAQSFLGIALKVGDENLGMLYINYHNTRTLDDDIKKTAKDFTDHVALALKSVKLRDQVEKAKATIEVAQKASEAAARTIHTMAKGDHKQTLEIITEGTYDVLGCDAVVLFTYDPASGTLDHPPTMFNVTYPERAMTSEKKLSESIVNRMLNNDGLYMAEDVSNDPIFKGRRFAIEEGIKSCIAVALKVGERKVGVMFVNYRKPHLFTSEDLAKVEMFANHAAVAIDNAQLFLEQSKRYDEQKLLANFSQSVLRSVSFNNIQDILSHAVRETATALGTEFCNIVLPDENGDLFFNAAYGWRDSLIGTFKLGKGTRSQTGYTIETEAPVIVYDYYAERRFDVLKLVFDNGIMSGMSVPIIREGRIVGAMLVHTKKLRKFTEADARLLRLIANQVAMLLAIVQHSEERQQHNKNLQALYKAVTSLTVEMELRAVLDSILEQAVEWIMRKRKRKVVLGTIQLYTEKTQELVFESVYPAETSPNYSLMGERWCIAECQAEGKKVGVTGRALLKKEPQLVGKVSEDQDYIAYNATTESELAVPLIHGKSEVIGVLDLESDQEGGFDEGDKDMLKLLGDLAVIAIRRAQQNKDLQQEKASSIAKDALVWLGMSSSYGRHSIQGYAISICDRVDLIRMMPPAAPISEITPKLGEIMDRAEKIRDYPISATLSSEEPGEIRNLNALLRRRVGQLRDFSPEKYRQVSIRFDLRLGNDAPIRGNSDWLIRALDVLIDNAAGAMENSLKKLLLIRTWMKEKSAVIEIVDTGHGIPDELRPKILNEQITHEKGSKRLGMGLLMAQFIVRIYKGNIEIVSSDSQGTTMAVYLPLVEKKQV